MAILPKTGPSPAAFSADGNGPALPLADPRRLTSPERPTWQKDMQSAFRDLESLLRHLELEPRLAPTGLLSNPAFPLLVTRSFADRIAKGDWLDPLLLQVLPRDAENYTPEGFRPDAVGDLEAQAVPGLLHKYRSRALLLASPNCAIHCRYCFRREFPYGDLPKTRDQWEAAWTYLDCNPGIDELLLSGGDPLFLDDRRLGAILLRASRLHHVRTLRLHTRLPVVLPSRVDAGLLSLLGEVAAVKTLVVVIHANHPAELRGECLGALDALRKTGALLLNQSVLLKGINDDSGILAELSRRLVERGVLPYYLHQLDRVSGAAHFEASQTRGLELVEFLRGELPGYAVPRYVRESAGEASKLPILP